MSEKDKKIFSEQEKITRRDFLDLSAKGVAATMIAGVFAPSVGSMIGLGGVAEAASKMTKNNFKSVTPVLHVNDFAGAVEWYAKWLGRKPDVTPYEGIAEWKLAENAWIQVSAAPDPSLSGKSFVVCGVHDLEVQRAVCKDAGVTASETQYLGFIKLAQVSDPAGNIVLFVQEMEQS